MQLSLRQPCLSFDDVSFGSSAAGSSTTQQSRSPVGFLRAVLPKESRIRRRPCYRRSNNTTDDIRRDAYDVETVQAIRSKDLTKLRQLLEAGKSFDACNLNGETLLHLACRRGDVQTVLFLIEEANVDLDVCDGMGRNVLHDVCWRPSPDFDIMDVVMSKLSPDALLAEDARGHTPFDYVRKEHWESWTSFLEMKRASLLERQPRRCSSCPTLTSPRSSILVQ